jgi:hypothetical protein
MVNQVISSMQKLRRTTIDAEQIMCSDLPKPEVRITAVVYSQPTVCPIARGGIRGRLTGDASLLGTGCVREKDSGQYSDQALTHDGGILPRVSHLREQNTGVFPLRRQSTPPTVEMAGIGLFLFRLSYGPFSMPTTGSGSCSFACLSSSATSHIWSSVRTPLNDGMPVSRMPFLIFQ